eukprot:gnl/Carplike_NY0171/2651_a3563_594.p1 GENE.gnl/Carplike_NY0171/2651_a3563_594~~gnl/Carplike_NY0171/2651_a3563_594.p1  ORF type:complete len:291 (+),score=21.78 gnl/Carplike_NY0171/2651_a3563_594:100-972(+)
MTLIYKDPHNGFSPGVYLAFYFFTIIYSVIPLLSTTFLWDTLLSSLTDYQGIFSLGICSIQFGLFDCLFFLILRGVGASQARAARSIPAPVWQELAPVRYSVGRSKRIKREQPPSCCAYLLSFIPFAIDGILYYCHPLISCTFLQLIVDPPPDCSMDFPNSWDSLIYSDELTIKEGVLSYPMFVFIVPIISTLIGTVSYCHSKKGGEVSLGISSMRKPGSGIVVVLFFMLWIGRVVSIGGSTLYPSFISTSAYLAGFYLLFTIPMMIYLIKISFSPARNVKTARKHPVKL